MLWFNADKGFGFIRTEQDERLYVARTGFLPGRVPVERCAGREVTFERVEGDTQPCAVGVDFPPPVVQGRARRRHAR
jgi:cold shock CspA family protein